MSYFPGALALASVACLIAAGFLAWHRSAAAAAVMASLFVASATLSYMPQLDSFKAFTVEVRLNHTLARADEVVRHLRELSIANGKVAYRTEAINLLFNSDIIGLQKDLDAVDTELISVGASPEELADMRRPYIAAMAYRLNTLLYNVAASAFAGEDGNKYRNSLSLNDPRRQAVIDFHLVPPHGDFKSFEDWKEGVENIYVGSMIPEDRRKNYRLLWDDIENSFRQCAATGRANETIESFVEKMTQADLRPVMDDLWNGKLGVH